MSLTLEEVAGARSQVCGPEVCVCRGVMEAATGSPAWREHRWGVQGKRRVREGVRVPHVRMPRGFRKWRGERKTAVKRVQREREGRRGGREAAPGPRTRCLCWVPGTRCHSGPGPSPRHPMTRHSPQGHSTLDSEGGREGRKEGGGRLGTSLSQGWSRGLSKQLSKPLVSTSTGRSAPQVPGPQAGHLGSPTSACRCRAQGLGDSTAGRPAPWPACCPGPARPGVASSTADGGWLLRATSPAPAASKKASPAAPPPG